MLKREVHNKLLLLRLIELSNDIVGKTRLQKLVFEVESNSRNEGLESTFNYKFIRWHYGPYSKEVTKDMEFLMKKKLVDFNESSNIYKLTDKGKEFIQRKWKTIDEFGLNEKLMKKTITKFNDMELKDLLEKVYKEHKVNSYNMGETIEDLRYVGV